MWYHILFQTQDFKYTYNNTLQSWRLVFQVMAFYWMFRMKIMLNWEQHKHIQMKLKWVC